MTRSTKPRPESAQDQHDEMMLESVSGPGDKELLMRLLGRSEERPSSPETPPSPESTETEPQSSQEEMVVVTPNLLEASRRLADLFKRQGLLSPAATDPLQPFLDSNLRLFQQPQATEAQDPDQS